MSGDENFVAEVTKRFDSIFNFAKGQRSHFLFQKELERRAWKGQKCGRMSFLQELVDVPLSGADKYELLKLKEEYKSLDRVVERVLRASDPKGPIPIDVLEKIAGKLERKGEKKGFAYVLTNDPKYKYKREGIRAAVDKINGIAAYVRATEGEMDEYSVKISVLYK